MEDTEITDQIDLGKGEKGMLFAVFDGHGGKEVAEYAKAEFKKVLMEQPDFKTKDYEKALVKAFMELDANLKKEEFSVDTGATSCVVLITKDFIYCANAGDSRAVLKCGTTAVGLSEDHKPDNAMELARIEKSGHIVEESRVDGNLALSRAFGDYQYKDSLTLSPENQAVTADPDIVKRARSSEDKFILLACDGIWDCMSNERCVEYVTDIMKKVKAKKDGMHKTVEIMLDDILAVDTSDGIGTDNMTAVLIYFHNNNSTTD